MRAIGAVVVGTAMLGDTRDVKEMEAGSLMKAALGAVSGVVLTVAQASVPASEVVVQPAGKAGAVTPSKASVRGTTGVPVKRVQVTTAQVGRPILHLRRRCDGGTAGSRCRRRSRSSGRRPDREP